MSLLWKTATTRPGFSLTAAWAPADSEDHVDVQDHEPDYYSDTDSPGARRNIQGITDSIRQHGYSPERHGKLGLNLTDHGENIYGHAKGSEEGDPDFHHVHHEHLLQALKDTGHSEVPMHVHDQRSEEDGEDAPKLYHGTTEEDLERVHPNHGSKGTFGNNGGIHDPGHAYATDKRSAWSYATQAADMYDGGKPHVYQVAPRGPVEKDPTYDAHGNHRGNYTADMRSKHGFDVIGEEEPDENTHRNYFQDHDEDEDEDY